MLLVFGYFLELVKYLAPGEIFTPNGQLSKDGITLHISLFHTLFNVCNVTLLIGFISQIEKASSWLVRKDRSIDSAIELAGVTTPISALPYTGELNLAATESELRRLSQTTMDMFDGFVDLLNNPKDDRSVQVKELKDMEELVDQLSLDITNHLVLCSVERISIDSASSVSAMLIAANQLEEISDCCYRLVMQDQDSVKVEMICISILGEMEKIGNHCLNIIQTLSRKQHP